MIVLDTHALVWWVTGDEHLSQRAAKVIERETRTDGSVVVSAISVWEIALLVERGRIALAMELDDWLAAVESLEGVKIVPVTARVAVQSIRLPGAFHRDPADRMIVALARELNAPVITADEKIQQYPHVKWIW